MNPTTQSSTTSTHPARQQRILRLPEVKAKPAVLALLMAVDKPSASTPLPASDIHSNMRTLPAGFAYNAQNWLVMQPAVQDSPVKICSWQPVLAIRRGKLQLFIALVRR